MIQHKSIAKWAFAGAALCALMPSSAAAQLVGYEDVDSGDPAVADDSSDAPGRPARTARIEVVPYVELQQLLVADLSNGGEVLTYSTVAAGVQLGVSTRRAEAQADVRYERRIAWNGDLDDQDIISGIARARYDVLPSRLAVEAGALATRARSDIGGDANGILVGNTDNTVDVYSIYAGPTVSLPVGAATLAAGYRFGYNRVESDGPRLAAGGTPVDVYDDSTNHLATVSLGVQPGQLPVGLAVGAGYEREDTSQLDQRYEGKYARVDATVPVSPTLAVVAGVGYEDIEVSQRDPLLDGTGNAVIDGSGRFVTDPASSRRVTVESDGLIYDAGVMWRPSARTSLDARVGKRYGDLWLMASYQQQLDPRTNFAFGAYQTFSSYGRRLTNALASLPTQFDSFRNPLDGSLGTCFYGSGNSGGGACLDGALAGTTTANFLSRGAAAQLSMTRGRWNYGVGVGVDQREFEGQNLLGTIDLTGVTDESYYANVAAGVQLDARSSFDTLAYLRYFDNGIATAPDVLSYGATAAYNRQFLRGLSGVAALGINGYKPEGADAELIASVLLGARYSF
ncbi:MAG: hypothetical protein GW859_07840 [Sphingomonadales bacterium]|nr:hypothetical protein [Sphingomonadales bacterium]